MAVAGQRRSDKDTAPPAGENGRHVAWRIEIAREIAEGYQSENGLVALTVAGSVGAGLADRWSDLEIDCYWSHAPSDAQRRAPLERIGASDQVIWDYDPDDREWSEDYRVGRLAVNVSNFTAETVEEFLDRVIEGGDTDPVKHMRLAAIERCAPLRGGRTVEAWRARAREYPDALVDAMVAGSLRPACSAAGSQGTRRLSGAIRSRRTLSWLGSSRPSSPPRWRSVVSTCRTAISSGSVLRCLPARSLRNISSSDSSSCGIRHYQTGWQPPNRCSPTCCYSPRSTPTRTLRRFGNSSAPGDHPSTADASRSLFPGVRSGSGERRDDPVRSGAAHRPVRPGRRHRRTRRPRTSTS